MQAFPAVIQLWRAEHGGRRGPVVSGYRPPLFFAAEPSSLYDAAIYLVDTDQARPGDEVRALVRPLSPPLWAAWLVPGLRFELHEGMRVVGVGTVLDGLHEVDDVPTAIL